MTLYKDGLPGNQGKSFLEKIKVLGIDLDGVVYEGNHLLPGAAEAINSFYAAGYHVEFITNNSFRSSSEIELKLKKLGINQFPIHIINSIDCVVDILQEKKINRNEKIHVIGSGSLKNVIEESGYQVSADLNSQYLVVGFTPDFSYDTVAIGLRVILNGAVFIACNEDANYPDDQGQLLPGCGALVSAIAHSAQHAPDFIAGKPSTFMLEKIRQKCGCHPFEILVIGDTLESDIQMANNFGACSAWVNYNGITKQSKTNPTFTIQQLSDLTECLPGIRE